MERVYTPEPGLGKTITRQDISFVDWLAERVGTRKWVVFIRLTPRLKDKGYTLAISPKRYRDLYTEWEALNARP